MGYFAFKDQSAEAVAQGCSVKKVFLENLQNSQENTCTSAFFLIKLQAGRWKFLRTPFHRTPPDDYFWRGPLALNANGLSFKYQQKSFKAKTMPHILNCVLAFHFHRKILRDQFWSTYFFAQEVNIKKFVDTENRYRTSKTI